MSKGKQPVSLAEISDIRKEPRKEAKASSGSAAPSSRKRKAPVPKVQLNVRVSVETYEKVVAMAEEQGCSMAEVIEGAF